MDTQRGYLVGRLVSSSKQKIVSAPIIAPDLMQMKDCVYTSQGSSVGPSGKVLQSGVGEGNGSWVLESSLSRFVMTPSLAEASGVSPSAASGHGAVSLFQGIH